jgi:DNA-binding NtrC family response regulator
MENVIERAMILTEGDTIRRSTSMWTTCPLGMPGSPAQAGNHHHDMEKTPEYTRPFKGGRQQDQGSTLLGISIRTLRNKLNEYTRGGQISDDFPGDPSGRDPEDS